MKNPRVIDPILALAFITLAERKNEVHRLTTAIRKAAKRKGLRRPDERKVLNEVLIKLRALTRSLQETFARILKEQGPELVRDVYFQRYLVKLQTGHLDDLIGAITWAEHLVNGGFPTARDFRSAMLCKSENDLRRLLSRSRPREMSHATATKRAKQAPKVASAA